MWTGSDVAAEVISNTPELSSTARFLTQNLFHTGCIIFGLFFFVFVFGR